MIVDGRGEKNEKNLFVGVSCELDDRNTRGAEKIIRFWHRDLRNILGDGDFERELLGTVTDCRENQKFKNLT